MEVGYSSRGGNEKFPLDKSYYSFLKLDGKKWWAKGYDQTRIQ
jgi:hypothetical protein